MVKHTKNREPPIKPIMEKARKCHSKGDDGDDGDLEPGVVFQKKQEKLQKNDFLFTPYLMRSITYSFSIDSL